MALPLTSLVAEFIVLRDDLAALTQYRADLTAFDVDLLRHDRTFAEKLFAVHSQMLQGMEDAEKVPIRLYV